jgi:hypothetical protein
MENEEKLRKETTDTKQLDTMHVSELDLDK